MGSSDLLKDEKNRKLIVLMAICLCVSALAGLYYYRLGQSTSDISVTGFDLARVESRKALAAASSFPSYAPASSPAPILGGLSGGGLASGAAARPGSAPAAVSRESEADRRHEKEFLARRGAELARYEQRLARITARYYKMSPVVRSVDHSFGQMNRYMAVKRKYEQDGNPYEFIRASIALPEVRAEISRRLSDPEVWKASLGMISDTLRDGPPPWVYKESQGFLLGDPQTVAYIQEFSSEASNKMPSDIATMIPPENVAPMMKLVQDVSGTPAVPTAH